MDLNRSSSNSPIHQLDYSNGGSSPLSNQSFNGTMLTIKTSNLSNMQTNGSSSIASLETNHLNNKHSEAPKRLCLVSYLNLMYNLMYNLIQGYI